MSLITINGQQYTAGSPEATTALQNWGNTLGVQAPTTQQVTDASKLITSPGNLTQPATGVGSVQQTNQLLGGNYFDVNSGSQIKPFTTADAQANVANYSVPTTTLQNQTPVPIAPTPPPSNNADVMAAGAASTSNQMTAGKTAYDAQVTSEQGQYKTLSDQISSLLGTDVGRGQATLDAEAAAGVPGMQTTLQGINSQIQTKLAEFNKIQSQYGELMQTNEMKTIPMNLIIGKNAEVQRSLALQKNTFASDIGLLQATAQGLQGQIDLAKSTADRAVDLKYQDIESQLNVKVQQLGLIRDLLSADEKRQADALDRQYQLAQTQIANTKATEKQNFSTLQDYVQLALKSGQSDLAQQIGALDISSPSFQQNLAQLQGKIQFSSGTNPTASIQEYEYAKSQGYSGTFNQYQTMDANRKALASGGGDKLLSVTDAQKLGVPYGTTESQAIGANPLSALPETKVKDLNDAVTLTDNAKILINLINQGVSPAEMYLPFDTNGQKFAAAYNAILHTYAAGISTQLLRTVAGQDTIKSLLPSILGTKEGNLSNLNQFLTRASNAISLIDPTGVYRQQLSGTTTSSNTITQSDGTVWQKNADGSYTRIK